jgi:hypothetical protein
MRSLPLLCCCCCCCCSMIALLNACRRGACGRRTRLSVRRHRSGVIDIVTSLPGPLPGCRRPVRSWGRRPTASIPATLAISVCECVFWGRQGGCWSKLCVAPPFKSEVDNSSIRCTSSIYANPRSFTHALPILAPEVATYDGGQRFRIACFSG